MTIDELTKNVSLELYRDARASSGIGEPTDADLATFDRAFESEQAAAVLSSLQNSYMDLDSYLVGLAVGWKLCNNLRNTEINRVNELLKDVVARIED